MEIKKESTPKGAIKTNQVDYNAIQRNLQLPERIPPYKLSVMFKQAEKIINQLINAPHWQTSYDDIEFMMKHYIKQKYGESIRGREVDRMSDNQEIALYMRIKET